METVGNYTETPHSRLILLQELSNRLRVQVLLVLGFKAYVCVLGHILGSKTFA